MLGGISQPHIGSSQAGLSLAAGTEQPLIGGVVPPGRVVL